MKKHVFLLYMRAFVEGDPTIKHLWSLRICNRAINAKCACRRVVSKLKFGHKAAKTYADWDKGIMQLLCKYKSLKKN